MGDVERRTLGSSQSWGEEKEGGGRGGSLHFKGKRSSAWGRETKVLSRAEERKEEGKSYKSKRRR